MNFGPLIPFYHNKGSLIGSLALILISNKLCRTQTPAPHRNRSLFACRNFYAPKILGWSLLNGTLFNKSSPFTVTQINHLLNSYFTRFMILIFKDFWLCMLASSTAIQHTQICFLVSTMCLFRLQCSSQRLSVPPCSFGLYICLTKCDFWWN